MRNAITLLLLLLFPLLLSAQNQQSKDSIQKVFDLVFEKLEADYLHRKEIDWEIWKQKIYPKALASPSLDSALHFSSMIFDSIACNHCMIFSPESYFSSSLNQALEQEDFSSNFLLKYEQEPGFEAKLIQEEFGYILIPGMLLLDADQDSLNRVAQHMYDKILSLSKAHEIKGWVIDLRFNIGGNLYPMLAALYHLLGDAVVYTELDDESQLTLVNQLDQGAIYCGEKMEVKITPTAQADLKTPVALISGRMTASAGEGVAMAFKGREKCIFLGEESYGLLTGNGMYELAFDVKMAMTTCYLADRNHVYRKSIIPDVSYIKQDNFEDPMRDPNIIKAVEFFNSHRKK